MKSDILKWVIGGVVGAYFTSTWYMGVNTIPKAAALETKVNQLQHEDRRMTSILVNIRKDLSEINERLARIETKIGN